VEQTCSLYIVHQVAPIVEASLRCGSVMCELSAAVAGWPVHRDDGDRWSIFAPRRELSGRITVQRVRVLDEPRVRSRLRVLHRQPGETDQPEPERNRRKRGRGGGYRKIIHIVLFEKRRCLGRATIQKI
jgi:hypothetical protein